MLKILFALSLLSISCGPDYCGNGDTICAADEACIAPPENCLPVCVDGHGRPASIGSCNPADSSSCGPDWFCTTSGVCVTTPWSEACGAGETVHAG